jgi:hypothetical protein
VSPEATCTPCPTGATCDGDSLLPVVIGSRWAVDTTAVLCVLQSCPPGYELINTASGTVGGTFSYINQQCKLCAASSYCPGGVSLRQPCPLQTFSPPGSSALASCKPAVLVEVTLLLQQSPASFDTAQISAFSNALAYTCGVPRSSVVVISASVPPTARRAARANESVVQVVAQVKQIFDLCVNKQVLWPLLSCARYQLYFKISLWCSTFCVFAVLFWHGNACLHCPFSHAHCLQVAAKDFSAANSVRGSLGDASMLNVRLNELGLSRASVISVSIIQAIGSVENSPWPAVGAALACMALVVAATAVVMWWWRSNLNHESEDEWALRRAMETLRTRLGIQLVDGFAVGIEASKSRRGDHEVGWRAAGSWKENRRKEVVTIQRSCLEAAGRMELRQVRS